MILKRNGDLNNLLGRQSSDEISNLKSQGDVIPDSEGMTNHANDFYIGIAGDLRDKLGKADPNFGLKFHPTSATLPEFEEVTENETILIMSKLKNNSALSPIPTKFLKLCSPFMAKILSKLFNECLTQSHYPSILKTAIVRPIFKGGDNESIKDYRPISILPVIDKIFETVLFNRLYSFFDENSILSSNQFGYQRNRSTSQAVVKFLDHTLPAIRDKNYSLAVMIDLSKAFDCVDHMLLLAKLHRYGIRDGALRLIRSYLYNRKQCVKIKDSLSEMKVVRFGVPQGSVLGPLLYIIYSNDLNYLLDGVHIISYADDTALCMHGDDLTNLITTMNGALCAFSNWSKFNYLPINYNKCEAMIITNRHYATHLPVVIDNNVIKLVDKTNYLGISIDNKLTMTNQL